MVIYKFLKNSYGAGKKIISVVIFIIAAILIIAATFTVLTTTFFAIDVSIIVFLIIFDISNLLAAIIIHMYIRKHKNKKPYKKIYFFIAISTVTLISIVYSPILIFGNAVLRFVIWIQEIPKVIYKEKWYLLLIAFSGALTCLINKDINMNYKEQLFIFILIYLTMGLCFSVVPYILFYSETKRYFSDFLNHSLLLLFFVTLILNILAFILNIDKKETIILGILNLSTIMVAWKRVYDFSKNEKSKEEEKQMISKNGKKICVIDCSYQQNGISEFLEKTSIELKEKGFDVEIAKLNDYNIDNCSYCQNCIKNGECSIDDDAKILMAKMIESDGIILGDQMYCNNISGKLKTFVDRTIKWYSAPELAGKPILYTKPVLPKDYKLFLQSLNSIAFHWGTPSIGFIEYGSSYKKDDFNRAKLEVFAKLINNGTDQYIPSLSEIDIFQNQRANAISNSNQYINEFWKEKNLLDKSYFFKCKIGFGKKLYANFIFKVYESINEVDSNTVEDNE